MPFGRFAIPLPPHVAMPSPKDDYTLDIMPEDRFFTDARPDDLIVVSVNSLLHLIVLIFFKHHGHDWSRKEHCKTVC
jgi:hypothetical protein